VRATCLIAQQAQLQVQAQQLVLVQELERELQQA
jgi:hypothetical protein